MGPMALAIGNEAASAAESPRIQAFLSASGPAYQLAARILGTVEGAEDVVQQAYLGAISGAPGSLPSEEAKTWFLKVVSNTAKMHMRSEARRRRREVVVAQEDSRAQAPGPRGPDAELIGQLRRSMAALDEKYRLPVALCCEQGFSHRTAAEILGVPASTVSLRVSEGLERLRSALSRSGYAAAPAAVLGALAHTAPPVPAGLVAGLKAFAASHAAVDGSLAAGSLAGKGGLIMKVGLGVAALGLVTGTAIWAAGGSASNGAETGAISCPNPLVEVREGEGVAAVKDDPGCVLRLAGTRGGAFSGQVVVQAAGKGPEAKMSDLKLVGGGAVIPASAVEVRYALPTGVNGIKPAPKGQAIFDALAASPRTEGTVHPVWVTVNVPADAKPGDYEGKLSIAGREVPVKLAVAGWALPKPQDFRTVVDFAESPESVALQYNVPLWSDEHVKKLGTVFDQLAKVGNKTLYLHLAAHSNLGNAETVVRWVKTEKEKAFKHDFTPVEKYLDTAIAHGCRPQVVFLYVWEPRVGGSVGSSPEECQKGVLVTLADADGKLSIFEGPSHNNKSPAFPNYPDDQLAFWKPVLDGLNERFKARGLDKAMIAFGLFKDGAQPGKPTVDYLHQLLPDAVWACQKHGLQSKLHDLAVGYSATVWNAKFATDPAKKRLYGWQEKQVVTFYDRDIWKPAYQTQLVRSRLSGEMNITGEQRGVGRLSGDFWPVLGEGSKKRSISSRYPDSDWVQLNLRGTPYLYPGPDGALGTIRLEMLREGVQECEARIFIEKALLDKAARAKLGDALAGKCQELLDARTRTVIATFGGEKAMKRPTQIDEESVAKYSNSAWQDGSASLYSAAAEVAAKLGGAK